MEDKILNTIKYYFYDYEGEDILFDYSAYDLYYIYGTLFNKLKEEIQFNLKSVKVENNNYLNTLEEELFRNYIDDVLQNSKYIKNEQIYIDDALLPNLRSKLSFSGYRQNDDAIFDEQNQFINVVKKYYLFELKKHLQDIRINSTFEAIKVAKNKNKYSFDYLNLYCEYLNADYPLNNFSFNFYTENFIDYYSRMFINEFKENIIDIEFINVQNYISFCISKIRNTKHFDLEENFLNKYIKEYNLSINEFPFTNFICLGRLLATHSFALDSEDEYSDDLNIDFSKYYSMLDAKKTIEYLENYDSKDNTEKIIWSGKITHIGFVLGTLALKGFIDAPKHKNGEINFAAFSRLILENFDVDIDKESLRKYLNPEEQKFNENFNAFTKANFNMPNIIEVS